MGLRLFFLPNFPGTMFIQGGTFIPDSRVGRSLDALGVNVKLYSTQIIKNYSLLDLIMCTKH
jgi:hypothetical protein